MGREAQPTAKGCGEKEAWDKLWLDMSPGWLLHACSHGSVDAVKVFVDMGCSPNYERYSQHNYVRDHNNCFIKLLSLDGKSPLSCAAAAGKVKIVNFLLELEQVKIPKNSKVSCVVTIYTR